MIPCLYDEALNDFEVLKEVTVYDLGKCLTSDCLRFCIAELCNKQNVAG